MKLFPIIKEISGLEFKNFFANLAHKFEDHISKSIPSYGEMTYVTALAVAKTYKEAMVLDIGSSEGYWGDAVVTNNPNIIVHSLDPNWRMKETFMAKTNRNQLKNNQFLQVAFGDGFYDPEENQYYEGYKPDAHYDLVRESMTFQFLSTDRASQYGLVKKALKPGGVFLTNSKTFLSNKDEYQKYEKLKDDYKKQHFSQEEITKKANEILVNMEQNMVDLKTTYDTLNSHFSNVKEYWTSANFHGFVCSDSTTNFNAFISNLPQQFQGAIEGKKAHEL